MDTERDEPTEDDIIEDAPLEPPLVVLAARFVAGALVTAVFSGSLAMLAPNVGWGTVLAVGMAVPSLTWVVQITAAFLVLPAEACWSYWGDLGWACLLGSFALLPAAFANFCLSHPPLWFSAANVLVSVGAMAAALFWRTLRQGISPWWAASWCLTITLNMLLFLWVSRGWW